MGDMVAVVFSRFVGNCDEELLQRGDLFSTLFVNRKPQKENFDAHKQFELVHPDLN